MNLSEESITPMRLEFNDEEEHAISLVRSAGEVINNNTKVEAFPKAVTSETPRLKRKRSSKETSSSGSGYPPLQLAYGFGTYYGRCTRTPDGVFIPVENSTFANPDSNWTTWSRCNTRFLGNHFPVSYTPEYMKRFQMKRRCCKVPSCYRKPSVYCMTCGVALCITMDLNGTNCFVQFHTKMILEQ